MNTRSITRQVTRAVTRAVVPSSGWSVLDLFSSSENGLWVDALDFSTVYQETGGGSTLSAVSNPVGTIRDKSGNGNHVDTVANGNRPTLEAGGARYDGTNDFLKVVFGSPMSTSSGGHTFIYVFQVNATIPGTWRGFTANENAYDPMIDGNDNGSIRGYYTSGTGSTDPIPLNQTQVVIMQATTSLTMEVNGVSVTPETGITLNAVDDLCFGVVSLTGTGSGATAGILFKEFIALDRALTASEVSSLKSYLTTTHGVSL